MILAAPLVIAQTTAPAPSQQELLETVNILKGRVADLSDGRDALQKQVQALQSKVDELSAKLAKPPADYATPDDIKALKAAIEEVDKKRQADNDKIVATLNDIAKNYKTPAIAPTHTHADVTPPPPANNNSTQDGPGFNWVARPNDTLNKIVNEFNKQHPDAKTSVDDLLKANPALKNDPKNLKEGQKLFIPSAKGTDSASNN